MKKDLISLLRLIEQPIVSLLLVHGYAELQDPKAGYLFSNITITKTGRLASGKQIHIPDKWIDDYRKVFPKGQRGTPNSVRERVERFLSEHTCSLTDIEEAAKLWVQDKGETYCGTALYFLYKRIPGQGEISRCEEYIELVEENLDKIKNDWRNEVT